MQLETYKNITNKIRWNEFIHNGPLFPELCIKKDIPIIINGIRYTLPLLSEEYAMLYAKYIGTEYVENKTFNNICWNDF